MLDSFEVLATDSRRRVYRAVLLDGAQNEEAFAIKEYMLDRYSVYLRS
jgi:hypothetical protein